MSVTRLTLIPFVTPQVLQARRVALMSLSQSKESFSHVYVERPIWLLIPVAIETPHSHLNSQIQPSKHLILNLAYTHAIQWGRGAQEL